MKLLYIAYSCDPYNGSEDKIGWNVPLESTKTNEVYVITKEEHRENIKKYMLENNVKNMHVYYIDIPFIYKKLFKGFLYSGRLNIWNRKAFPLAKKICEKKKIDLIHQITPIEFRSIGNYGRIKNTKFVCGPLGGGEKIPNGLKSYVKSHEIVEIIRMCMNYLSRFRLKIGGKLKDCDCILFANKETRDFLLKGNRLLCQQKIITEIAISNEDIIKRKTKRKSEQCRFLVAGRLIYRKGHSFLLDVLERIPEECQYQCRIVGSGPEYDYLRNKCNSEQLKEHVILIGNLPFEQMKSEYEKADVLIMPSLRETTGSVILEAMAKGIPIVTIGKFGGIKLVDNSVGWTYGGKTKEEYINNLKNILIECINCPQMVCEKGENACKKSKKYTWEIQNKNYQLIYRTVLKK